MNKDEALQMAIDLLESMKTGAETFQQSSIHIVCAACEEALATNKESLTVQPAETSEQEPVAIVYSMQDGYVGQMVIKDIPHKTKLYTLPQAREWKGLTDDEISKLFVGHTAIDFAYAINAKLKEKNYG